MSELNATKRPVLNIEDFLVEAGGLTALAIWIEQARHLCDQVATLANVDPELSDRLRGYGVRCNSAEWTGDTSDGMQWLHHRVRELMQGGLAQHSAAQAAAVERAVFGKAA